MTDPNHSQIFERIGAAEVRITSLQEELTEFKDTSREYRERNREDMTEVKDGLKHVIEWTQTKDTQGRLLKRLLKGFGWCLGLAATGLAVMKGLK